MELFQALLQHGRLTVEKMIDRAESIKRIQGKSQSVNNTMLVEDFVIYHNHNFQGLLVFSLTANINSNFVLTCSISITVCKWREFCATDQYTGLDIISILCALTGFVFKTVGDLCISRC